VASCSGGGDDATATSSAATPSTTESVTASAPPTLGTTGEVVTTTPDAPASSDPAVPIPAFEPEPIAWEQFNDAVDVGTLEVPVDYAQPDGARFELFLARYNALDQENKIGTLLVNPGGPGYPGTDLALTAADRYDRALRDRFDIIGWDPRGVGQSDPPIDCIDDYDEFFAGDGTPQNDAERDQVVATAQRFADECAAKNADIVQHVGTNDSARDIDVIRRALGEDTISYFGFSYGSELGGVWATMFPDTVRAIVLDGASDPDADPLESNLRQWTSFEAALSTFLAECSDTESCPFNNRGDAEGAFDALMAQLDTTPIAGAPDRPPVNRTMATVGVLWAMYSDALWPALAESLAAAQRGDGGGLLEMFDTYYERQPDGTWGNQLEAFRVISCIDRDDRRTVEEINAQMDQVGEIAPRLMPAGAIGSYACAFLPPSTDPRIEITGAGAGPVLVIGTTGDPSTPLESSRSMSDSLEDGRLVVVDANQHTGYGANRCVIDVVNQYLIDLQPPPDETTCG
jgi:pimeloyl-ACP methyl ester carboxylesterase